MSLFKKLVFSGVQPTGKLHLGNYLGAIRQFIALQKNSECIYCIVDLHAITTQLLHENLRSQIHLITASFLAVGIDPVKNIIFNQSSVPQHAELAWILNCVTRIGWINRMTQFKEKAGRNRETASLGLYSYPVLMAADILLYRANCVPVGDDQKQHLELTRDIAQKFNMDFEQRIKNHKCGTHIMYGEQSIYGFFPIVEPLIDTSIPRVMSLKDASKKMSKSDSSDLSRINLLDSADMIAKKIRKAKTDSEPLPSQVEGLKNRPEAKNLVAILAAITNTTNENILKEFGGKSFSSFKLAFTDAVISELIPISEKIHYLLKDPAYIDNILYKGSMRARILAQETIHNVHKIIGLIT
ncbi:Tryptophanyl-tRNA synthetase [Liberibacter crescens BT-1]|uniref:Tryptophan--tRNA ligase n=1 Tax=Liberibacter crescens (strain BT-1) TaxID=1215343 RepID=L0ERC4_LIBCB|nr:tryptophan--tRNA ligase [Liberibacter crescens]AGA64014.1 Tryptophanyl-tRNA synthetase [Liberibacter crescens BT-1]AMC12323.1 tryptophanyl-tRNA synthetase [Liberibacter crescens]